jgi:exopolyphosphatase/guanosine-5'-triphosphate,3'-diphosphate pyrophosphatase
VTLPGVRAAIDVGTNSVRLLVCDAAGAMLAREVTITRLGQGVDASGILSAEALERTFAALRRYQVIWEAKGSQPPRIAATSAVRDASNRDEFFTGVREITGVEAEVLSGIEEARTAFAGAADGAGAVAVAWPPVVVDIGGGSTELIVGAGSSDAPQVAGAVSLQLGSVRLTERCLAGAADPPTHHQVREAQDVARTVVTQGVTQLLREGVDIMRVASSGIGVAGTITTIAQVDAGHTDWVDGRIHGHVLTAACVRAITRRLCESSAEEIAQIPAIAPGRRDVIAAGSIVLSQLMEVLGLPAITVSESDILDGLVRS